MRIQASKVFADFINKTARKHGARFEAEYFTVSEREFYNLFNYSAFDRYDMRTKGRAAVICVTYPANYYAVPVYVNTAALNQEYKRRGVIDLPGLESMILELFSI